MQLENISQFLSGYDNALFGSFLISILIILSGRIHIRYSSRGLREFEVQRSHVGSTPRIGGLAILVGCTSAWYNSDNFSSYYLGYIILSGIPVLIFGLLDDFHFKVRPIYRLIGASISSIVAILLLKTWLNRVDVWLIDQIFLLSPFAILFTIFATTGVAHSFNVIDGLNGLSLGIALSTSFFLTVIAWITSDVMVVLLSLVFFLSALGLFLLNFPWGKIFLGDGGAYFQGHCLSWIAIILITRNPEITAWAILLIFFWPVVETLFSIYRRVHKKKAASTADREHFHQLVFDKIRKLKIFENSSNFANSFSTLLILPLFIAPNLLAIIFYNNIENAAISFFILLSLYIFAYNRMKASF
ncbi:glycosyltransferase [Paracoccaceae bacterium]|nr:glycosyltransferase [Paracoccaceae bacterium]